VAQHYTRSTLEASSWCAPCGKNTPHSVFDRRIGACLICLGKLQTGHDELAMKSESYEERAAIKEYVGNLPREQAEREAHEEVFGKIPAKQERMF
jgi:hypothetical protein